MPRRFDRLNACHRQGGFVLVTALIFLIVLSVLGVMAMRGSLFEERMSANDRDMAIAREYAEMALRDAERDIMGLRFDGSYCSATPCGTLRPAGTRPTSAADAKSFWQVPAIYDAPVDIALDDGGATLGDATRIGVYSSQSASACGKPVWSGANWADGANPARQCDGTIAAPVPTVAYGTFTDAPFVGPDGVNAPQGIPAPRYIIEMFPSLELMGRNSGSAKVFFRITAVGFGRSVGPNGRTSITLQSVFSPI